MTTIRVEQGDITQQRVDAIVTHLNTSAEATHVLFHELKRENAAQAGKLACD